MNARCMNLTLHARGSASFVAKSKWIASSLHVVIKCAAASVLARWILAPCARMNAQY